ncbi:MAG: GumC family protein [Syntrophobacteraceae bacterium]
MRTDPPFDSQVPVPSHGAPPPALTSESMLLLRGGDSQSSSFRDYLSIFFKRKFSVFVSFMLLSIISVSGVLAYTYLIYTPKFLAKSLLLVKSGWENYSPDFSLENRRTQSVNQTDLIGSEARILESRDLKERVINTLKPENIFPELGKKPIPGLSNGEAALIMLEKDLLVTAGKKGSVIEVGFTGTDPGRSAAVVNQLVHFYIDKRSEIYKDPKSVLFLEKKADEFRQKLADSENRMRAFREETKIISFDEQRTMLLNQRSNLIGSLNGAASQIKEVQERITELEKQLTQVSKTTTTAGATERRAEADSKLLALQLQEKELVAKYKEDNRLVTNIRDQIQMVKEHIEGQAKKDKPGVAPPDPVYQDIQKKVMENRAELSALKIRHSSAEQQLQNLNAEIQTFEARENRNKELLREIASNDEKYRTYRQRLEEAKIFDELDRQKMTSVSLIEPATAPLIPVNPPKPLILLIVGALVASLIGSLGLAYLREQMKQGMSTPTEAERRLKLPVLISIPVK